MIQNLNIANFLAQYWQKKPLLIRNAFPDYNTHITAEELAGLSCEDFVESRIISEHKTAPNWRLEHGPFPESRFSKLPQSHWTLLIQGLNKIIPEFDELLQEFSFIPSWRVDDVMASFAVAGGSVGPHIDQYDVFLLQSSGRRKWMISQQPVTDDDLEPGLPLKIIKNFKADSEWVLEPGDMLYLPPNVAHYGIALDECMTLSIGFRAPSHAELISGYVDERLITLKDEHRYQDADLEFNPNCGEISRQALDKVYEIIQSYFSDKSAIDDWFGKFITDYLADDNSIISDNKLTTAEFTDEFKKNRKLYRPASVRANYISEQSGSVILYVNGNVFPLPPGTDEIARQFCNQYQLIYSNIKSSLENINIQDFLTQLYNMGYLEFANEVADIS